MNKTVYDNIIIDIVRTENSEINPKSLSDEQCEQILQNNVDQNGSIKDKERALLNYSEKISRIPISLITQNENLFWFFQFVILLIIGVLSYWLMKKTIDPNQQIIYIDNVFWQYCLIQLLIWAFFLVLNWLIYLWTCVAGFFSNNKDNKNKASVINFTVNSASLLLYCIYRIFQRFLYVLYIIYYGLTRFRLPKELSERLPDNSPAQQSDDSKNKPNRSLTSGEIADKLAGNEYMKCSMLLGWKLAIIIALGFGAGYTYYSFFISDNPDSTHIYGFTSTDPGKKSLPVEYHARILGFYEYLHELNDQIKVTTNNDIEKKYSVVSRNLNKNQLAEYKIRYAWDLTSARYNKETQKDFNTFCFWYMEWCLITPVIPHLIYFVIYFLCWCWERYKLLKKHSVMIDSNGVIADTYQKNVLGDLERQYKRVCSKLIWLQIPEESVTDIKLSDLKSYCDESEKDNVILVGKEAVNNWVKQQNKLSDRPYIRTLVCLCDINHRLSKDCINRIFKLSNKDKYDIRIALVYDKKLKDDFNNNQNKVSQQLKKWKSELESLEEVFSQKYAFVYKMDSQFSESKNWRLLNDGVKNSKDAQGNNLALEEAFNRIFEDLKIVEIPAADKKDNDEPSNNDNGDNPKDNAPEVIVETDSDKNNIVVSSDNGKPSGVQILIPVSEEIKKYADRFTQIIQLPPPDPQPRCVTLIIFNGIKQEDFIDKFNECAGPAQKAEKRLYQKINDPKIQDDITADRIDNPSVYYRLVLIAKAISRFEEGKIHSLTNVIKHILSKEQTRPVQVTVVATDIESVRKGGYDVESYLDYWGGIVVKLKSAFESNVNFIFEDKFDYPIAPPNVWTNFCSKVFPDLNISVIEKPSPEQRKRKFSEALQAIKTAGEFAFDNKQDENSCIDQTITLNEAIHDIYCSKDGLIPEEIIRDVKNNVKKGIDQGQEIVNKGKDAVKDGINATKKGFSRFFNISNLFKSVPFDGLIVGGLLGTWAPTIGLWGGLVLGGYLETKAKDLYKIWSDSREKRRASRAEKEAAFKEKPEDEQDCILQVESLIASGLTWSLVYDGQGYSEETILETIKQVLQPLELVHIYTKDDIDSWLNEAQRRWENRYSINNF